MKALVLGAACALLAGPVLGLAVLCGTGGATSTTAAAVGALCATSGAVPGLNAIQARNARTIVAVSQQVTVTAGVSLADQARAEMIALMTAQTESTLHDYSNPTVAGSSLLPNDGPPPEGGDHDSVGLFQQRANWGTVATRMDPTESTRLFVTHLLAVADWQTMPAGVAAQTVQQSRYPDRYAAAETSARTWLRAIVAGHDFQSCGGDGLPRVFPGSPILGAMPPGYAIPADATDQERRAVTFALAQLGKPYVFGAAGPDGYDCSGLTMAAWAVAGVDLPHYTVSQYELGTPVAAPSLAHPGDLIFIPGSDGSLTPPDPQHVGMYLGYGLVIEAPQTGDVVKIVRSADFGPVIGIRHYG